MIDYTLINAESALRKIALVEKKTKTEMKGGENGGVTLSGTNVVRNFQALSDVKEGKNSYNIDIPSGLDKNNISIVLYHQKANNEITAACQSPVLR